MIYEVFWIQSSFLLLSHVAEGVERIYRRGPFSFFPSLRQSSLESPEVFVFYNIVFGIVEHFHFLTFAIWVIGPLVDGAIDLLNFLNYLWITLSSSLILSSIDGLILVLSGLNPESQCILPLERYPNSLSHLFSESSSLLILRTQLRSWETTSTGFTTFFSSAILSYKFIMSPLMPITIFLT